MTPREPDEVDRKLRRWLWQEEQRWKRARHADLKAAAIKADRDRDRVDPATRAAAKAFAAAMNAGAASVVITSKSAREARKLLGLDWFDVSKLSGILPSFIIGFEGSGRSTVFERRRLQQFYECEGLAFDRDGGVSWAE